MRRRLTQIYFYLVAFSLLILVLFFVNRAYQNIVQFWDLEENVDAISMQYQNLSRQVNSAAVLTPGLEKVKNISNYGQLFLADSQAITSQLNLLNKTASDSLNRKIAARLSALLMPELRWLLTSNVPDSVNQHKALQHVSNLMRVDSLVNYGIEANEEMAESYKEHLREAINNVRLWIIVFTVLAGILLIYTIRSIFIKDHKIKSKEEQLEIYNRLLQDAQSTAHLGNWEYYPKKEEIHWSDEMYKLWHVPKTITGIEHSHYLDKIHPADKDRFSREQAQFFTEKNDWDIEFRIITPEKLVKWLHAKGVATKDENESYFRGTVQDITDRKKAEEETKNLNIILEEKVAQRTEELQAANKEMEAFTYSVSHDLRAPLRGIIGFSNILAEEYKDKLDAEANRLISVITGNTKKMGLLIDDLLSFSRLGRQKVVKTTIETDKLVQEIIAEFHPHVEDKPINWQIEPLPNCKAHAITIKQVWANLISNAIKYSYNNIKPQIGIGTLPGKNETIFFIKDNGVGFDEKYKEKLFRVFQRLHSNEEFEGTGVGLAIVDRIIAKHGGRVWAKSEPGNGATFYFSLPDN